MTLLDPYEVDTSGAAAEETKQDVALVDLRASGKHTWLHKPMELPKRWFKRNHGRIPLLREILQAIRGPKRRDMRAARCREYLVALKVREGRVLWFKNDSRMVLLAVKQEPAGVEDLTWFLQELQNDIAALQEDDIDEEDARAQADKEHRHGVPTDIQEMVGETVRTLQEHPECAAAKYLPSKNAMKVVRKGDRAEKRITIKKLKKLRSKGEASTCEDAIQRQFDKLHAEAAAFLDGEGGGTRKRQRRGEEPAVPARDGTSDNDDVEGLAAAEELAVPASGVARGSEDDEPAAEEPAAGGPAAEEPAAEEPVAEEPAAWGACGRR